MMCVTYSNGSEKHLYVTYTHKHICRHKVREKQMGQTVFFKLLCRFEKVKHTTGKIISHNYGKCVKIQYVLMNNIKKITERIRAH